MAPHGGARPVSRAPRAPRPGPATVTTAFMIRIVPLPLPLRYDELERRYQAIAIECPHVAHGTALIVSDGRPAAARAAAVEAIARQTCRSCELPPRLALVRLLAGAP